MTARRRREGSDTSLLVTAKEAARITGLPYTTVRDLHFRGQLPVVKFGRAWWIRRSDLERVIERHVVDEAAG